MSFLVLFKCREDLVFASTGAVMFLFEGNFGTVLHTGDCRITPDCYAKLPRRLFGGLVDCLFLDCTFGKEAVRMPQREDAIKQVRFSCVKC